MAKYALHFKYQTLLHYLRIAANGILFRRLSALILPVPPAAGGFLLGLY